MGSPLVPTSVPCYSILVPWRLLGPLLPCIQPSTQQPCRAGKYNPGFATWWVEAPGGRLPGTQRCHLIYYRPIPPPARWSH